VFVDQVEISVESGHGGKGNVSFRREKYVPKGGPDGGNGGRGGDVILVANSQLHTLLDHRYKREYVAEHGQPGTTSRKTGRSGEDLIIQLPCGTLVRDAESGEILADLVNNGQRFIVAHGGLGGRGNAEFATPTQQTPRHAEPGLPGKRRQLMLELKLIADVGLVGFPNAGKSTLISRISAARPKIADYPFTTLEPNLGIVQYRDYDSFTVADLPGLIEGAHEGKGLGTTFLRHIERTRILLILIDCTSEDYASDLAILRNELSSYSDELASKPWFIGLSKIDAAPEDLEQRAAELSAAVDVLVHPFSSVSGEHLEQLKDLLWIRISTAREGETGEGDEEAPRDTEAWQP